MKISVECNSLNAGLQQVMNVVGVRPVVAILGNVLLEAADGQLTLTTTNLDCSIRCVVVAEVTEPGRITVNVRKLGAITKALACTDVDLELLSEGKQLKVSGGGSVFRMITADAADFPPLPAFDSAQTFSMEAADLHQMVSQVAYAQSTDDHRLILNGIYFNFSGGRMTLVATDGRRLAVVYREMAGMESSFILPGHTVEELGRLLADATEVLLSFNTRQIAFRIAFKAASGPESVYIISKVLEGDYPNYQQVIPSSMNSRVRIHRELLIAAIQRATLVTSATSQSVKLTFSENLLEISASSAEYGNALERLAISYEVENPVEIGFNPRYLVEPLRAIKSDEIIFEFRDHLSAGVIRTDGAFLCVVMPLRAGVQ